MMQRFQKPQAEMVISELGPNLTSELLARSD